MSLHDSIQTVYEYVAAHGTRSDEHAGDRSPSGSYADGWRRETTTYTHTVGAFTLIATKVTSQRFNPALDHYTEKFSLKILDAGAEIVVASRTGVETTERFGAEERPIGREQTPEAEWHVMIGGIPPELQALF